MSIVATTAINDVKGDFEGGNSLSVDWDTVIRRAVINVLRQVRPETLKRRVPIYGGLAHEVYAYYCPDNVLVPSDLYSNDGQRKYSYVAPKVFHKKLDSYTYTIETINGVRFLFVMHGQNGASIVLDSMEAVGTKTGGTPTLNSHNYIIGSNSVEATFTDAGVEFGDDITAINISEYLKGVVILPAYLSDVTKLASIEVRLKTDDSNYYSVISTSDSIGDYLTNGWNMIKFEMQNASETGSPTSTNITEWSIIGTTTTGNTLTIQFDKFTIQKFNPFYFEFYTDAPYIDGVTGAKWKTTISNSNNDKINFPNDLVEILHYEMCLIVVQSSSYNTVSSQAKQGFTEMLIRAYEAYWETHPSTETPVSYSKSPEIDISQDIDYGRLQDDTISIE